MAWCEPVEMWSGWWNVGDARGWLNAMAPTCRRLLDQFFEGRTASELRLWDALDADLLVATNDIMRALSPVRISAIALLITRFGLCEAVVPSRTCSVQRVSWTARPGTRTMMLVQQATCS